VVAAGPGGGPHVRSFDFNGTPLAGPAGSFFAYGAGFTGGVFVAAADLNDDGRADIITGAGAGGGPHVLAFSGADGSVLASFFAYDGAFTGGVRVAAADVNGDVRPEIVTAPGPSGGPHIRAFNHTDGTELSNFFAYGGFTGGVFVAGGADGAPQAMLRLAGGLPGEAGPGEPLTAEQLDRIRAAAVDRWELAGASTRAIERLLQAEVSLADLPGNVLGSTHGRRVLIDRDAGGAGWFVDPTPHADEEFSSAGRAIAPLASERADLLTAILHEYGHLLGLEHQLSTASDALMSGLLDTGSRRLPTPQLVDAIFADQGSD
jgi:hypothetical protein